MARPAGRGLTDLVVGLASMYPMALRSGAGYWTEMVVNTTGYVADVVETAVTVAREPSRSRETLAELLERYRAYLVSSGDLLERVILDFNQALMTLTRRPSDPATVVDDPRIVEVFQQLADFAATEALKYRSGQTSPDVGTLRAHLEACLAELRRPGDPPPATP